MLRLLADEAAAEFMYHRSHGVPGSSCMPLEEYLAYRDAGGDVLWERWIWRRAEANSEAHRAAAVDLDFDPDLGPRTVALGSGPLL
jgi:hypothetical protein